MKNETTLRGLAAQIVQAQDRRVQLRAFPFAEHELTLHEAYEVSWMVHEERLRSGWKSVGRKIGFTNRDMWSLFGVTQPVWSFVYDKTYSDVELVFRCSISDLVQPRIEPEIVFRMRATPPAGASEEQVLECVEWMAHGIEMVQCHYPDWKFTPTEAVCDSSFHGALFVGSKYANRSDVADTCAMLKTCQVGLYKDGDLVEAANGRNVLGSPLLAVASLIDAIQREGSVYPILPGEIITTGTITKAYPVNAREQWHTQFDRDEFKGLKIDFF